MKQLSDAQARQYETDGYLLLPDYFSEEELALLRLQVAAVFAENSPGRILEEETGQVRAVHGSHITNFVFGKLVRLERMLEPAKQLLDSPVYVHQFKINAKLALFGEAWHWHQDFRFWRDEDGMPQPRALTMGIFMDPVDEFNGPVMFVPGTHLDGMHEVTTQKNAHWTKSFSADLKYKIDTETLADATRKRRIVAPKGQAGSALLFHGNILHGSAPNLSPSNRTIVYVTYNSVHNALAEVPNPRQTFLASRDFSPLEPLPDDSLS